VIREELEKIKADYGDERRTEITASHVDLTIADLIPEEERVVTISHTGYAKSQPLDAYNAQRRGGRGRAATGVKDEDHVEHLLVANSHTTLLLFSSKGKVYWKRTFEIPEASRASRGRPIVNLLPLEEGESITAMLPVNEYTEDYYIFMATAKGTVKKTSLEQFSRPRSSGLIALALDEDDTLISAAITDGSCEVMLFSDGGKVTRFSETDVRAMGRTARGVRGMRLPEGEQLISMLIPEQGSQILTASERGYGKRTEIDEFPSYRRGGQGVIAMVTNERNGKLVGAIQVLDGEEIMLISDQGTLVRTRVDEVSSLSRNTQGVMLIRLAKDESLVGLERVQDPDDDEEDNQLEGAEGTAADETTEETRNQDDEIDQPPVDETNNPQE